MSWAKEFIELDKAIHDRASFDCGEVELNEFIRTKAAKHMEYDPIKNCKINPHL